MTMALKQRRDGRHRPVGGASAGQGTAVLRLVNGQVVECDPALRARLDHDGWQGDLPRLRLYFAFRFADLPADFPRAGKDGSHSYTARASGDTARLSFVIRGPVSSVILRDPAAADAMASHVDRYRDHFRQTAEWITGQALQPTWIVGDHGGVIWSNPAYRALLDQACDRDHADLPILCRDSQMQPVANGPQSRERFVPQDGGAERWFDVTRVSANDMTLFQANDVTAVVQAESAQKSFVQTLTKTFAQLSTGLAIFDRNRQLALFNPALIDLTGLRAEFLSARPGHLTFFDKLRDEQIMPEPRNYGTWRDQIIDVITRAEHGRYHETWSLPQGNTYRVTGRPHPNGAVAFLFEDISAEVTLTRRFREQLDLSQAVMDSLDDALAVFSPQGALSYTNDAYRDLWSAGGSGDPADSAGQLDQKVADVSRQWQDLCGPDPTWGDFRDFVVGFGERCEWDARVRMRDGRTLDCRFKPLQGGATLASFRVAPAAALREISSQ